MKRILVFVLFTISLQASAQKNEVLVPFRKGDFVGLSNLNGRIVLNPIYSHIEPMGDNFFKFSNSIISLDSTLQNNGSYKKYTTKQSRSGVISGRKVIIPESEYNTFLHVPEGFIVGARDNYTKDGGMFFNLSGKKLLNEGVLSYRFVSFAMTQNPIGADHSAIIVAYKDLTYNVLDFQKSKQEGRWMFNKNVTSLVLDSENSGADFFVMSYDDSQGLRHTKRVFYQAEKDELVIEDFSKVAPGYYYQELNYSSGSSAGEYDGSSAEQYTSEVVGEMYAEPENRVKADSRPSPSAPPNPSRSLFTFSENGVLKYGEREVNYDNSAKLHFYEYRSRLQGRPIIFEMKDKFGIIYSDTMKSDAIYDTLVYLKAKSRSPSMGEYYYLAGKKQDDNSHLLGIVDMEGKVVIPFDFSSIIPGMLELEIARDDITAEVTFQYKKPDLGYRQSKRSMEMDANNIFTVTRDGKMGLIDISNEVILPIEYELIFKNTLHFSTAMKENSNFNVYLKDKLYGVFRLNGKAVTENSNPQFPFVPVFYYNDYCGNKGLRLYNLAIPDNLYYVLANQDGKLYFNK